MNHIQISITAAEAEQELLISALSELNATGFEQTETQLVAYFPEESFASYDVLAAIGDLPYQTITVAEKNWNEEWERNFSPVVVEDFCAVRAHFHAPLKGVEHEIVITPKMSFGTGHHATTYLVMKMMRGLNFAGKKVFDFGTGTGILAILAEKLGATDILATDNDQWSIDNATENVHNNECSHVRIALSDTIPAENFDIILANINRNVILHFMAELKAAIRPGGEILFSGLLTEDGEAIRAAAADRGLQLLREEERNGWIALWFSLNS